MTVLLDADHHLAPDALRRAGRWLADGYDVVQGRCAVRNLDESWIASLVATEFEQMYGLAHQGRSLLTDTAIFGGTNGFWRTSLLRRIAMDTEMLTEDIDSSVRALLGGARLVHDRSIVSTELATPTVPTWYSQRLRWAQGWFQVTVRHQRAIWRSDRLSPAQKVYWTYVLGWREIYPALSLQVLSLLTADLVLARPIEWVTKPSLMISSVFTVLIGLLATVWTWKVSLQSSRDRGRRAYVLYAALSFPYTVARNGVALIATLRELIGYRRWVVTRRVATAAAPEAAVAAAAPEVAS
jgi:cellulose synthase/poly-beta-1,6-N-acetylglucosamine synthase-like glycosyltransferase